MMKILWLTNHETGYYRYLFEKIQERDNLEVEVAYRRLSKASHPWKQNFSSAYKVMPVSKSLKSILSRETDLVVVGGWNYHLYILAAVLAALMQKRFALLTDTVKTTTSSKMAVKRAFFRSLRKLNSRFRLFTTGEVGVQEAIRILHLDKSDVINFPWVTNNELFSPAGNVSIRDKVIRLVAIGRLDLSHKGQDIALRAISNLPEELRSRVRLILAGSGPDREAIVELINELSLNENVEFSGWLEEHEVVDLVRNAHTLLHPSHFDPYPNCVLEALSCGVPVMGSNAAGSVIDRVKHDWNGWVHEEGDDAALTAHLLELLTMQEEEYQEMRSNARKMALRWPVEYNLEILNKILST